MAAANISFWLEDAYGSQVPTVFLGCRSCSIDEVFPSLAEDCGLSLRFGGHGVAFVALPFLLAGFLSLVLGYAADLAD